MRGFGAATAWAAALWVDRRRLRDGVDHVLRRERDGTGRAHPEACPDDVTVPGRQADTVQYDAKRAKLQKAVDAGSMTQDAFDKLDAELVRCLE